MIQFNNIVQTYPGPTGPGVPEDAVRLSIGIEHIDDLLADLKPALNAV